MISSKICRGAVFTLSLSLDKATILHKIKEGYLLWIDITSHMRKDRRYTFGARVEERFLDLLEKGYQTYFNEKEGKEEKITECITILDTIKFLIQTGWEAKSFSSGQYALLAPKLSSEFFNNF